ncbi:hypothetical protein GJAV_G00139270 [Gymnothorax javanicus]|nr:hypothetical protein GJAV_G00139270 [Gymnothorax javanicus]
MNTDKKRGSFQITSVTSDFDRASLESSYKAAFPDCTKEPSQPLTENSVATGGQCSAHSSLLNPELPWPGTCVGIAGSKNVDGSTAPSPTSPPSPAGYTVAGLVDAGEGCYGGPPLLDPGLCHLSASQFSGPSVARQPVYLELAGEACWLPVSSPHSPSRFRVVRLGQVLGEPYSRGRWTCTDFLERDGWDRGGLLRVMDSIQQSQSLDSLAEAGLAVSGGTGAVFRPLVHVSPLNRRHVVGLPGTVGILAPDARSCAGSTALPDGERIGNSLAGHPAVNGCSDFPYPVPSNPSGIQAEDPLSCPFISLVRGVSLPHQQDPSLSLSGSRLLPLSQWPNQNLPALHLDLTVKPDSLAVPQKQDGGVYHDVIPNHAPSTLSLAHSMFGAGRAFDLDSVRDSSKSMMAIDSKIEQAMDLVKTHLMLAVREEVELLREQIAELTERNSQLERENYILRTMRERD